jgi:hypothetical protein
VVDADQHLNAGDEARCIGPDFGALRIEPQQPAMSQIVRLS